MDWDDPAHEINRGLLYEEDGRTDPDPDDQRLETFKRGWRYGVYPADEDFGELAFSKLSWQNLGYRLGVMFGETSEELQEELYDWCVRQMRESSA
ncbi:hypothetical protein EA462_10790 [Natrarchaeobius halalkaliphilus]|uniref:Uncharacterized protein n=1 Tax=Natrarchaeobius halalkaliphilus TaxID=1679091 RepID=A0A3N6M6E8_9EURY|nr:hypothetical protein [Natrarchaeobius halalkaliphilus]RQG88876.1 hypothetical protein EA462_10790 [Natrarchaeobius halalkaliphilus]